MFLPIIFGACFCVLTVAEEQLAQKTNPSFNNIFVIVSIGAALFFVLTCLMLNRVGIINQPVQLDQWRFVNKLIKKAYRYGQLVFERR